MPHLKPPASRGELIAACGLLLSIVLYFGVDRERQGAIQKQREMNGTLLSQRNRENDQLERRISSLEQQLRRCDP